ncbi:alpha/beta fold hydrolase [Pendulispora albinea]|uniref:Alpha/beta fold hydrolase n=1 Tax=Pendulispora albinea TaxID=2741071 RepID=A0ABZ2LW97_9BACT
MLRLGILPAFERVSRHRLHKLGIRSRSVETDIGRLHVLDGRGRGSLPPIVVLHGITSSSAAFGAVLAQLQRHTRRIIAPDAPGHGFSEAPRSFLDRDSLLDNMTSALDQILDEPAIVCGNSMGGAIALHYAATRPERVRGLVLLSPAGAPWSEEEVRDLVGTFGVSSARDVGAFMDKIYHAKRPWFTPLIAADLVHSMRRRAVRELLASAAPNYGATPEQLASLRMPTLLWWGRSERLLPASNLAYFREHLPPHAIIEEPEGIGHCPHFDQARTVSRRIAEFARSIPV